MRLLRQRTIPLYRTPVTGGYDEEGTWVEGTKRTMKLTCSVQPFESGIHAHKELQGVRTSSVVQLYTKAGLRSPSENYLTEGDLVDPFCDGVLYQVYRVQPWQGATSRTSHTRAYAYKLDIQGGDDGT